jgi:glycosyltransferase involved in cell wall biosynthesis
MTITDAPLRISVVIPHLNQPDHLRRCLASLAAGRTQPQEVIVVDNGSREMPEKVCAAFPGVTLLSEPHPGPGPARNSGVAASSGDVLAFIDADCLADPLWLWTATQALSDPQAQILGGDVRIAYADPNHLTMLEAYESIYAYRMDRYIAREGFTGTGNLVVRRPVLTQVGPFAGLDVAEDRDWGQRATRAGHRIRYVAGMKVYHPARPNFRDLAIKWERATAHDFVKAGQRPGGRLRFLLKTLAMPLSPLAELPRLLASDRIAGVANRAKAFACLTRIRLRRTVIMLRLLTGTDPASYSGAWNRPKA